MRYGYFLFWVVLFTALMSGCAPHRPLPPEPQPVVPPSDSTPHDPNYTVYYVKKGDTLYSIAEDFGVSWEQISRVNAGRAEDLEVGQLLFIPLLDAPEKSQTPSAGAYHVVIDPGHGGRDPGAVSPIGLHEKEVNLAVSLEAARLLRKDGFKVTMTRRTDIFVELEKRAAISNEKQADLFVSIHADSYTNPSVRGYTLYIRRGASLDSRRAGRVMDAALAGNGISGRGVREANYRVLVKTDSPSILIELGYLSNRREARMLADPAIQRQMAKSIAGGIQSYFQQQF